jgi:EmrB/QacA subfamily drug resistance transporter
VTIQSLSRPVTAARSTPTRRRLLPPGHPGLVLAVVLTCQLMVVLDATIVNVALNDIKHALHFSPAGLSWVVNAYTLTFGGLLLLGARAGDILGRRRTFLGGIALFVLASLAGGFAHTTTELLVARSIQGVGGALAAPSALALLMTMFPQPHERTRAIGLYTAVSIGGSAVGLIAGGMLSQWASWRWVLFVNVPIGLAVVAIGRLVLPETPRVSGRFDLAGALTSTVGMTSLVFGFVHAASDGWGDPATLAAFAAGIVLLAAFVLVELRAESPITPLRLFASRNRSSAYLARLLLVAGMMGMFFFMTQFLRGVLGYSDLQTGFAFVPLTVVVFIGAQLSARVLVDRLGARRLTIVGISLSTIGMLMLTQLSQHSGYAALLIPLLVFGTGNGLAFVPLTTAALEGVRPQDSGAASGLVNVMQQMGGSLGLAVLVTVFGTASADASRHAQPGESASELARHVFVVAADKSFWAASVFLAATWLLVVFAIRPGSTPTREPQPEQAGESRAAALAE